jgi:hypothetical protein
MCASPPRRAQITHRGRMSFTRNNMIIPRGIKLAWHKDYNGHYATPLQAGDLTWCTCHLDTLTPGTDTVSKRRKRRETDHHTLTRRLALLTLGTFSHSASGYAVCVPGRTGHPCRMTFGQVRSDGRDFSHRFLIEVTLSCDSLGHHILWDANSIRLDISCCADQSSGTQTVLD